ncbi:hypothetical protein ABBQ38_015250 [Trebouxia sp. C0009 RCD-2024]
MSAAPNCHTTVTVATFLKHPCSCNNRFIRQHAARLASAQSGSPRLNSKFAAGTHLHNSTSNGHKCSAFFKFGKSKENEYKGDGEGGGGSREDYSAEDVEYYFNYSGILAERGSYALLEDLLESGMAPCDILLLLSSSEGDAPKVAELLAAGAHIGVKGLDGKTALEVAKTPEVKELLQNPKTATA